MMNLRTLAIAGLALATSVAFAQGGNPADVAMGQKSDEILLMMRKVQIMNQILPLVMDKTQIRKILPTVEKVRAKVKEVQRTEFKQLQGLENPTKFALDEAIKQGRMPSKETLDKIAEFYGSAQTIRQAYVADNIEQVLAIMKETLNKGQLKAAANSLTLSFYEPNVKPEEATEDFRLRVFVREVMLDPVTYDLLLAMSK
jgi:hypothetical protein